MKTSLNFQDADAFYEHLLNARLILVMANQLGDTALLQACIEAAKAGETTTGPRAIGPVE